MNDFTKDELGIILLEMNISINRNGGILKIADSYIDLRDKVESMIDNYCEHEPEGDWHVCVDKCKKCGVIINDNQ
ncbi:TPA: hypothetical protein NQN30_000378 [Legionella pneumophila]|nr:hypothetical protein [Legionella pneumophila]